MGKRVIFFFVAVASLLTILVACDGFLGTEPEENQTEETNRGENEETMVEALANNNQGHDDQSDYTWNSSEVIPITLNGNSITENSENVTVEGSKLTIKSAGTYSIKGTLTNGQIIVNTEDEEIVRIIFNGVDITSSSSAPVYIKSADKIILILAGETENFLTDGNSYVYDDSEKEEPNSTIFSKSNLTFFGEGSLAIKGNFNDGISTKDGLIITSGNININASDDGIRGKDYLIIKNGNLTIVAGGDGLKSDNDEDEGNGYIYIQDGKISINSKGDAISAETDILIETGELTLNSGSVSSSVYSQTESSKGIKAGVNMIIDSGNISVNSSDDALHSNENITINGGTFFIASGDDGIHANYDLTVNDGEIEITESYEGIESAEGDLTINKGNIHLVSSDDGINMAGGGDTMGHPGTGSTSSADYYTTINGGYIYVNANGDGIDANGSIIMTNGNVIVNGPTNNGNSALDYNSTFKLTGGILVAVGSSGMAQAPGSSSTQYSVIANFSSSKSAGTLVNIQNSNGENVLTYKPAKLYQSIVFSSPELSKGSTYNLYIGGSSTGSSTDGLYQEGTYSQGTKYSSFTISGIVTSIK